MPLSTTVTPWDVAVALGRAAPESDSPEFAQWGMWITDALMLIQARADELSVTTVDASRLNYVIREAVVAMARRPDDATQVTVSIDDGSTSKTYRSGAGRVTILDQWWRLLGLAALSGAFTLELVGSSVTHIPWCSLNLGALYCSCGADIAGFPIYESG